MCVTHCYVFIIFLNFANSFWPFCVYRPLQLHILTLVDYKCDNKYTVKMEFNLEIRKKQLDSLKQYIKSSEDNVAAVFHSLGWNLDKTIQVG